MRTAHSLALGAASHPLIGPKKLPALYENPLSLRPSQKEVESAQKCGRASKTFAESSMHAYNKSSLEGHQ